MASTFIDYPNLCQIIQDIDENIVKTININYNLWNGGFSDGNLIYETITHSIDRKFDSDGAHFELTDLLLNHTKIDILWQNASPFSTFAGQTITIGKAWKYNIIYVIERFIKFGDEDSLEETLNSSYGGFCIPINTGMTTITDPYSNTTYTNENGLFMNTSIQMSAYDRTARTYSNMKMFARNCHIYGDDLANKIANVRMKIEGGHLSTASNNDYGIPLYVLGINVPADGYFALDSW